VKEQPSITTRFGRTAQRPPSFWSSIVPQHPEDSDNMAGPVDWSRKSEAEMGALARALSINSEPDSCTDSYGDSSPDECIEHEQARDDAYVLVLIDAKSHPVSIIHIISTTVTDVVSSSTLSWTPSIV
jgi:hypothetical protein